MIHACLYFYTIGLTWQTIHRCSNVLLWQWHDRTNEIPWHMWEVDSKGSFDSLKPRAMSKSISVYCKHSIMFLWCEFSAWPIISWYILSWCMSGNESLYFAAYRSLTRSVHLKRFICGADLYLIMWNITHLDTYVQFINEWDKINCLHFPGAPVHLMRQGVELCYLLLFDDSFMHTPSSVLKIHRAFFFFFFALTQQRIAATLLHWNANGTICFPRWLSWPWSVECILLVLFRQYKLSNIV